MINVPLRSILFLCTPNRRRLYEAVEQQLGIINWIETPEDALVQCVMRPPAAIVADIPTALHSEPVLCARLYDLQVDIPVFRAQARAGAFPSLCLDPLVNCDLCEALQQVVAGDPRWHSSRFRRKLVRVLHQCRVMLTACGSTLRANTLDISGGGCFVVAYDPLPVGTPIALSFVDMSGPLCDGEVCWTRLWSDHGNKPGMGLSLDRTVAVGLFGQLLAHGLDTSKWPLCTRAPTQR